MNNEKDLRIKWGMLNGCSVLRYPDQGKNTPGLVSKPISHGAEHFKQEYVEFLEQVILNLYDVSPSSTEEAIYLNQ